MSKCDSCGFENKEGNVCWQCGDCKMYNLLGCDVCKEDTIEAYNACNERMKTERILTDIFNVKEGRKEYYREEDGHTYYYDLDGDIVGAPTCLDDSVDYCCATYVEDFDIKLTDEELEEIKKGLEQ